MTDNLCLAACEHLSTEQIIEIRDGLKSGEIKLELDGGIPLTPEVERWLEESKAAMIEAYDLILARRLS